MIACVWARITPCRNSASIKVADNAVVVSDGFGSAWGKIASLELDYGSIEGG
jgi:hypothetical protein